MKFDTIQDFILIICEELAISTSNISSESKFRELENWSSLNALIILSRIHEISGVLITPAQLAQVNTIQGFYDYIK